jgi:hypothetical protein
MAGIKKATPTSEFNGQSYMIVFDEVEDYDGKTVGDITKSGFDVGQVYQGSTTWNGEDPSFEDELDEQGDIIVSNPTKGTFGFDFEMADFSSAKFKEFLKGAVITSLGTGSAFGANATATATTEEMPVITRPIALVNDTAKKALFFPKARILTGPNMENKLFVLKSVVKAQDCNVKGKLGTMMLIDKIDLVFENTTA